FGQVRRIGLVAAAVVVLLIAVLVLNLGDNTVLQAIAVAGVQGLLVLGLCHLGLFAIMGTAWRTLLPGPWPAGLAACIGSRMMR
ncbi:hypothetical protein ABTG19_19080, partial [Acinetobacter baumannii]